jgi:cell cycle arrest protein BUB3
VLSSHDAGAKSIAYSPEQALLISGGWDSTLHVHMIDNPSHPYVVVPLPSKPFSLSLTPTKLVVAMANRDVHIYDLQGLQIMAKQLKFASGAEEVLEVQPFQKRESSMKFMTRCVACMPNDRGFATSSIEGRIAVDWFDESEEVQKKKYAFKCHRQAEDGVDVVYPVNALAFHPVYQMSFASGGGDGMVNLWDGLAKRRIRVYTKFPSSISALGFSSDGKYLAVAVSPGFEDGKEDYDGLVKVFIRELAADEAKPKASKHK